MSTLRGRLTPRTLKLSLPGSPGGASLIHAALWFSVCLLPLLEIWLHTWFILNLYKNLHFYTLFQILRVETCKETLHCHCQDKSPSTSLTRRRTVFQSVSFSSSWVTAQLLRLRAMTGPGQPVKKRPAAQPSPGPSRTF